MEADIAQDEPIARFLRNTSHMRLGLGRPHFIAFLPPVPDGKISVYRTAGMAADDIRALGARYVEKPGNALKGHCVLATEAFFSEGLNVESDPDPHERHANVTGWERDDKNRVIARKLAEKAALTQY